MKMMGTTMMRTKIQILIITMTMMMTPLRIFLPILSIANGGKMFSNPIPWLSQMAALPI